MVGASEGSSTLPVRKVRRRCSLDFKLDPLNKREDVKQLSGGLVGYGRFPICPGNQSAVTDRSITMAGAAASGADVFTGGDDLFCQGMFLQTRSLPTASL